MGFAAVCGAADSQSPLFPGAQFPTGKQPVGVVAGDWNGDGVPDLAVVCDGSSDLRIYLGSGAGTYQQSAAIPLIAGPQAIASADFNGDSIPDFAVALDGNNGANPAGVRVDVLYGDGLGGISASVHLPMPILVSGSLLMPLALEAGDINGDGIPDIAVQAQDTALIQSSLVTWVSSSGVAFASRSSLVHNDLTYQIALADMDAGRDPRRPHGRLGEPNRVDLQDLGERIAIVGIGHGDGHRAPPDGDRGRRLRRRRRRRRRDRPLGRCHLSGAHGPPW